MNRSEFTRLENLESRMIGLASFATTISSVMDEDVISVGDIKEDLVLFVNLITDFRDEFSEIMGKADVKKMD